MTEAERPTEEVDFSIGVTADALRDICDLDPSELANVALLRGFGRDCALARCNAKLDSRRIKHPSQHIHDNKQCDKPLPQPEQSLSKNLGAL